MDPQNQPQPQNATPEQSPATQPNEPTSAPAPAPTAATPAAPPNAGAPTAPPAQNEPAKRSRLDAFIVVLLVVVGGIGPGMVLAGLYLLIKSFVKKGSASRVGGLVLLIVGLIISGAIFFFLLRTPASKKQTVQVGSLNFTLQVPAGNQLVKQESNEVMFGTPVKGSSNEYSGQIVISQSKAINSNAIEKTVQSKIFQDAVQLGLLTFCSNPTTQSIRKTTINGASTAYEVPFQCPPQSNGSQYVGFLVFAFNPEQTTTVVVAANQSIFQGNKQWNNVIPSLVISK